MTTGTTTEELRTAERRLQAAQLASDAVALDELLDDRLVFTGPDGRLYSKSDDLERHRTGAQVLTRVDEEELAVEVDGTAGVTWFLGRLEGAIDSEPFAARLRYTRTWVQRDGRWRLLAVHASVVGVLS